MLSFHLGILLPIIWLCIMYIFLKFLSFLLFLSFFSLKMFYFPDICIFMHLDPLTSFMFRITILISHFLVISSLQNLFSSSQFPLLYLFFFNLFFLYQSYVSINSPYFDVSYVEKLEQFSFYLLSLSIYPYISL